MIYYLGWCERKTQKEYFIAKNQEQVFHCQIYLNFWTRKAFLSIFGNIYLLHKAEWNNQMHV